MGASLKLPTRPTPNPYTDPEPFLTIPQAAAQAQIHERTLYARIKAGELPCYGSCGNYRVKLSDVLPKLNPVIIKDSRRAEATRKQHVERSRKRALRSLEASRTRTPYPAETAVASL